jgi:hypothetical protein
MQSLSSADDADAFRDNLLNVIRLCEAATLMMCAQRIYLGASQKLRACFC